MRTCVYSKPDVIPAGVSIFHPQLRDLLQPAGEKGKVLFIHRMSIEYVDFNSMTGPVHFCTLDFAAVCLTTGSGLIAAGGEHSELDIRPLFPLPNAQPSLNPLTANANAGSGNTSTDETLSFTGTSSSSRYRPLPTRWHLRTPTGGSINNSISIQPEPKPVPIALRGILPVDDVRSSYDDIKSAATSITKTQEPQRDTRHREKRRKEDVEQSSSTSSSATGALAWKRDEPWGRTGEVDASDTRSDSQLASDTATSSGTEKSSSLQPLQANAKTMRILISNNDRSVKAFRLRPPARPRGNAHSSFAPSNNDRIESGLPGLSRSQTVEFPTCVNHSSFSPDGRHVVSVGDTPDVFLFSVHADTGELSKIATYTASSDASFSTTWSPDSMQFAVASQDGFVSVWDVRSSNKIASIKSIQISDRYGAGAARVVKWSPRGDVLAFSEQLNWVQIVDAITFEPIQKLRVPSSASFASTSGLLDSTCEDPAVNAHMGTEADELLLAASGRERWVNRGGGIGASPSGTSPAPDATLTNDEWQLESTSPARFASAGRSTGSLQRRSAASLSRPWSTGRRYRDIGNTWSSIPRVAPEAPTDGGEWTTVGRHGSSTEGTVRPLSELEAEARSYGFASRNAARWQAVTTSNASAIANADTNANATSSANANANANVRDGLRSRTYAEAVRPAPASSEEMEWIRQARANGLSLDAILRNLHEDSQPADWPVESRAHPGTSSSLSSTISPYAWSMLSATPPGVRSTPASSTSPSSNARTRGAGSLRLDADPDVEISGLTWDPEGDYLYVSTSTSVVRYTVMDTRSSLSQASLR